MGITFPHVLLNKFERLTERRVLSIITIRLYEFDTRVSVIANLPYHFQSIRS